MARSIMPARTRSALQSAWQRLPEYYTVQASTKRLPPIDLTTGKRSGIPVLHLPTVLCTPLVPADGERVRDIAFRIQEDLKRAVVLLLAVTAGGQDIKEGDILVIADHEYPIRNVDHWEWIGGRRISLLVEQVVPT